MQDEVNRPVDSDSSNVAMVMGTCGKNANIINSDACDVVSQHNGDDGDADLRSNTGNGDREQCGEDWDWSPEDGKLKVP